MLAVLRPFLCKLELKFCFQLLFVSLIQHPDYGFIFFEVCVRFASAFSFVF